MSFIPAIDDDPKLIREYTQNNKLLALLLARDSELPAHSLSKKIK